MVGTAWGFVIGTKFTFCPVYVLWPIGLWLYRYTERRLTMKQFLRLPLAHLGHGVIALLMISVFYNFADIGDTLAQHHFSSKRMRSLSQSFDSMRSPFPKQFLVGIDEQQLDLEKGYPTYFAGVWYPKGIWWYYLAGLFVKEQVAFAIGLAFAFIGGAYLFVRRSTSQENSDGVERDLAPTASFTFCFWVATCVFLLLSWHSEMALNVRYAFPGLPPLMIAIGIGAREFWRPTLPWKLGVVFIVLLIVGEWFVNAPHFFAYANPLVGGSNVIPPVLHDSNFEGGQDLWLLEKWIAKHPLTEGRRRFTCVHGNVPPAVIGFLAVPPPVKVVDAMLNPSSAGDGWTTEIIVMRGFAAPAYWTRMHGATESGVEEALLKLLASPPDEWLSPTLVVFRD